MKTSTDHEFIDFQRSRNFDNFVARLIGHYDVPDMPSAPL